MEKPDGCICKKCVHFEPNEKEKRKEMEKKHNQKAMCFLN